MSTSHNPYAPRVKAPVPSVKAEESKSDETLQANETASLEVTSASAPSEDSVPEGPAAEVLEWVGDDKDRAQLALEAEEAGQQRVGLSKKLKELAE